ncbi:E1 ubiquitin-activating protein uba2 [Hypocenomyce scalaris]|nr:E1 ubiquitin-activating protein uba2 [Hypocenomyce scalaris]
MGRERYPKQSLGALYSRIKQSRILLVGAGGIGCELLKNLVLTGFGEIHIVDLDTIDLSNLNRQFLFRHEHIKKSKALVAKETAAKFNPHIKLEAHHANIKDPQFNIGWFEGFNLIFNALDNLDARRHVNRMCLAANVPLIESGTTGFNGQVQVIKKLITTREIFGTSEDEAPELDHSKDSDNAKEIETLRQESQALKQIRQSMGSDDFSRKVFDKVFKDDIDRLRTLEDMWRSRKPPEALDYDAITKDAGIISPSVAQQDQQTWTLAENFVVFSDRCVIQNILLETILLISGSLRRLSVRLLQAQVETRDGDAPILRFDKDDVDTLDFVAASANLRSLVFGIETRSKFDIKQMAGNIIPAIATTNAMTAGLCVLQAFKVMRQDLGKAKMVFLERSAARVINTDTLKPPNPNCSVCGVTQSRLVVDPARATLNDLVEDVLKLKLGYGEEFSINNEIGTIYDPELEDNLSKKFSDLGVKGDSFLTVIDDDEVNPRVNLSLSISEQTLPEDSKPVMIPDDLEIARKPKVNSEAVPNGSVNGVASINGTGTKRKRSADESSIDQQEQIKKRGKVKEAPANDDDLVVLDYAGDGAIVLDDD